MKVKAERWRCKNKVEMYEHHGCKGRDEGVGTRWLV